jgi:hypothetical protein
MTTIGWDDYVSAVRQRLESQSRDVRAFLWVQQSDWRIQQVLDGRFLVAPTSGIGLTPSTDGAIHDWTGAVFLSRLTPVEVFETLNQNDLRFVTTPERRPAVSGCIFRANYESVYSWPAPDRWWSISNSTRMRHSEYSGRGTARSLPIEIQSGYVRRLSCVTRAIEMEHGTLIEVQAIVLSPFPRWIAWLMQPIVRGICRYALVSTLRRAKGTCSELGHLCHETLHAESLRTRG